MKAQSDGQMGGAGCAAAPGEPAESTGSAMSSRGWGRQPSSSSMVDLSAHLLELLTHVAHALLGILLAGCWSLLRPLLLHSCSLGCGAWCRRCHRRVLLALLLRLLCLLPLLCQLAQLL